MPSSPLDNKHGRTTSGVACHHCHWAAQTVERRLAWHAIIAFGQHTWLNDVGRCMSSSPLASTHSQTALGVACHHRLWEAHTVERRRAWHAIIAFGKHTQSNDVGRGMTSPPLGSKHDRPTSGVTCHHRHWTAHSVERHRAWHEITALGHHTQSAMSGVA